MDSRTRLLVSLAAAGLMLGLALMKDRSLRDLPSWSLGAAIAGLAVIAALVAVFAITIPRRRRQGLKALAPRLGLAYARTHEAFGSEPFAGFPLFVRGHSRKAENLLRGGREQVLDFRYVTGTGKSTSVHRQTVFLISRAGRPMPRFELKPEGLFDRLGAALGGQDIDFEEDHDFSRRFRLRGEDEEAVRRLFHAGVRLEMLQHPELSVEGEGEWLAVYRQGRLRSPEEIPELLELARRISAVFPAR